MLEYIIAVLITAAFLMLVVRKDFIAVGAIILSFLMMLFLSVGGGIEIVKFGGWGSPSGIVWAMDGLSLFMGLLITGISSLVALYSSRSISERKHRFYTLLCLMTAGMVGISMTGDLFNLYVFFEIMSIASYGLVAFFLDEHAIEGAMKYLIMGSLSTSFILTGIALIYGMAGTLNFADLSLKVLPLPEFLIPLGIMLGGFSLKAAVVPFHAWKPDAIEGTPSPIGAIFTTVSAAVGVYCIARVMFVFDMIGFNIALIFFGLVTMVVGAALALVQVNVKRMLAYSSISQMGYIVMALGLGTALGITASVYHIFNNALIKGLLFMSIGSVILLTGKENLDEMGVENTPLLLCVGVGILSLAGVPPLNGFVSKWLIFMASWEINPVLTVLALVSSALTLAYGLKIFSSVFMGPGRQRIIVPRTLLAPAVILAAICILISIFPQVGLSIVEPAANALMERSHYITAVLGG